MQRFLPRGSDEVVPPPKKFYQLKDYDRNPFYMAALHAQRPGYRKLHDPYQQYLYRRSYHWVPKYKNHHFDAGVGPVILTTIVLLPIFWITLAYWEIGWKRFITDPLSFGGTTPKEI